MAGSKHIPNTQWNEDRPRQAYQMALCGLTNLQIAHVMDVSPDTITYWTRTNKDGFADMLRKGKEAADMKVAENFYLNCQDRYVEEEEAHLYKGQVIKVKVKKFIQGDKWAQLKWLALRQRGAWTESQKIEIMQTNLNITKIDFSNLSTEELMFAKKIGLQLTENASEN